MTSISLRSTDNGDGEQQDIKEVRIFEPERKMCDMERLTKFAYYMNPQGKNLSIECPQLNAAPLFGSEEYVKIGYPDVHPSVSMWGHDTYITGWVVIGEESAIYPGCNFNGDAPMPLIIGKRCSLQHVELHYSGFRMLPTIIGDDTFLSHLSFGHSVKIGKRCYILGHVTMYDGAVIEDDVFIEGNSTILGSARLKQGWAYEGRVDKHTKPMCKTSEVVFGRDPQSGELLYIGGGKGVATLVNNSHLSRNANQMRLVALKLGCAENNEPACAVVITHVYQTAAHYLAVARRVLDQLILSNSNLPSMISLSIPLRQLVQLCADLCDCIRVIHDGYPTNLRVQAAWLQRATVIHDITVILEQATPPYFVEISPLAKKVILDQEDLRLIVRKLREFDSVMQQQEKVFQTWEAQKSNMISSETV